MRILFVSLLLLITGVNVAQDWAPFKQNDTKQHFYSEDSVSFQWQNQIQSIVLDSSYIDSNALVYVLKQGFSKLKFNHIGVFPLQKIKGQVLGDSIKIYTDSSIITSIDLRGFRLYFPHQYAINQQFNLGVSNWMTLTANVDSMYQDSLSNGILDSLVLLSLSAFDTLGNVDTTGNYHHSKIIISKSHGLVQAIDFTNLYRKVQVNQFFLSKNVITNREDNYLTVGDEYHYEEDSALMLLGHLNYHTMKVIADTLIGANRTLSFEHKWRKKYPPSGPMPLYTDTLYKTFLDTGVAFVTQSGILEDSILTRPNQPFGSVTTFTFTLCNSCGFNDLWNEERMQDLQYNFFIGRNDSIYPPSALAGSVIYHVVGVGEGYRSWGQGGVGAHKLSESIVYVKKVNQSWGTPLNLVTGLYEIDNNEQLDVYPNPASNFISIDSKEKIEGTEIYDLNGRKVGTYKATQQIDISNLHPRIYYIQFRFRNTIISRKFIKQ